MPTLIRELIDIPEQVHRGDFVLRLTEGIQRPESTLDSYVVTPQLAECFGEAMRFIRGALDANSSKGAYLHGSFGSGKSHFMAVLSLLLAHDPKARAIPQLANVIGGAEWSEGKRFLLVPYHMIGAASMESAILGHYVSHVRTLHPDAPMPAVFKADSLLADADALRKTMSDPTFFARLNDHVTTVSAGWGTVASGWDAESYEAARASAPGAEGRTRLVGDLIRAFFPSYAGAVQGSNEAYVPLDVGLSAISQHARALGYHAVILFLDELILWLASHAADPTFVSREGQKLAQLVESQHTNRPIPIVSFVARQRDLRDLVGEQGTGAQGLAFADVLRWWEARFHTITLEDRNLPAIAEKRVLRPRTEAARQQLDEAFRTTTAVRPEVLDTLLTSTADREMFRKVYPFSPVLVQALVAVSSLLQRERTALKVMVQLLVNHRDTLALGDLVPVGDLFDVIADGDEAFTEGMRAQFDNARKLYDRTLRPILLETRQLTEDRLASLPASDPQRQGFRADDRLVKTLLLAALVPELEAFRALTPTRLATLNHGTIRTPIPGAEAGEVLRRLRLWAARVGELKITGATTNPTIAIQITGVDTEGIIEQARSVDNHGNRKRLLKEMLFSELGIEDWDRLFIDYRFTWRGTERNCEVVYGNVYGMPDSSLQGAEDSWRVVVDYPFDEEGRHPTDDLARLQTFRQGHDAQTIVWIPSFLSLDVQRDLGTLVILEHILTGERFAQYSAHLPPVERATAKQVLDNRRGQLREKIRLALESAYGVHPPPDGILDSAHSLATAEHFQSLDPALRLQPPAAANLGEAFQLLLGQALATQFPAHPAFEVPAKSVNLRKVLPVLLEAARTTDGRVLVDRTLRDLVRGIAEPLDLGRMAETHFVLGQMWFQHFTRMRAQAAGALTVGQLRRWTDEPTRRGLPEAVQNLIILVWAEHQQLAFIHHDGVITPSLESMRDELELRAQRLPPADAWQTARARAAAIFGIASSDLLNASNVGRLVTDLKAKAQDFRATGHPLVERLTRLLAEFGVDAQTARRLKTARAAAHLVDRIAVVDQDDLIANVAAAPVETSEAAMARSLTRAGALNESLDAAAWPLLESVGQLTDDRQAAGRAIRQRVAEALEADELALPLAQALRSAQDDATRLLVASSPVIVPPRPDVRVVDNQTGVAVAQAVDVLRRKIDAIPAARRERCVVTWTIEERD